MIRQVLRFLAVAALALWLGGITFYGAVVIPTAHEVMGSHREIGFVTRVVTGTSNAVGHGALALLLAHLVASWRALGRRGKAGLAISLGVMAAAQVTLLVLRAWLDPLLDPSTLQVLDRPRFMPLHERYLNVTGVLVLAGLVHLWVVLSGLPPSKPAPPPAA